MCSIETSPDIKDLAGALLTFQAAVHGVVKDSTNPAFKSKYASLEAVIETAREPLQTAGLAFVQTPGRLVEGVLDLTTMLIHAKSGQWMRSTMQIPVVKRDAQGVGSAVTYASRYSLMAMLGIPPVDDDGNEAVKPAPQPRQAGSFTTSSGKPPADAFETAMAFAKQGTTAFERHIASLTDQQWAVLKPRAKELHHIADQADAMEPAQ